MPPPATEEALIAHLRGLPGPARAGALDEACASHPALQERRPAILAAIAATAIQPPPVRQAVDAFAAALAVHDDEASGARIGPYKLLQKLGEGGFGMVWMAEQLAPVRRHVAVKILKLGMDTEEVIARFEAERQAVALMEHPNIARVFDAGATDSGRPYFVMELVRGIAITRYCDENRLSSEARLRLFITVCHAVQHAHQKGVIHRDLKPSNILVTLHDGVPVPKIIDFGIAKATNARLTDRTLFTQFHAFLGTPAYTSPEQMEMSGLDVDTRSDIYSLGVLLYELLTGRPPFDADALARAGIDAMRRMIREIDPPRPSTRVDTLPQADRTSLALQRGTDSAKLAYLLRGDLDWIVMRCLEKDRTRRYDTPAALAADVQHHLAHEPVAARPPSGSYRLQKFCRRHRTGVFAAAVVTIALVAGLIVSSALLVRERTAHGRAVAAEQAEGKLRQEAEVARAGEEKRAIRTALDLANRNLADGHVADGLAYLVYAARKDPLNPALAPRIASVLASNNFAIPQAAPLAVGSRVQALRFTQDGRLFVVGTEDGKLRVLDAETGGLKRQIQLAHEVLPEGWVFAGRNDTAVAALFSDNTFSVHDLATGEARFPPLPIPPEAGLPPYRGPVGLSPDARWVYTISPRGLWLWDARTGVQGIERRFPPGTTIGGLDFSPKDDILAIRVGQAVERWSLPSGQPLGPPIALRESAGGFPPYAEIRFSPDGRHLAVFNVTSGQVYDSATGALVRSLAVGVSPFSPGLMSFPDNDHVFVATYMECGWWDFARNEFTMSPIPNPLKFSFDAAGRRGLAMSQDGYFRAFDAGNPTVVAEAAWGRNVEHQTAISPDGTEVLLGTADGLVYRFDIGRGGARPLVLPRPANPFRLSALFLPETPARLLWPAADGAKVLQVASGREVAGGFPYPQPILAPNSGDTNPPVRPDLKFMVVRTQNGAWESWELGPAGVRHVVRLREGPEGGRLLTFSPSGDWVALSSAEGVRAWHLRSGMPAGPLISLPSRIVPFSVSFSEDARRLGVGGGDGSALVFDLATAQPTLRLKTLPHIPTLTVGFSADGGRIVTTNSNGEIRLWHAKTGEPVAPPIRMTGVTGSVNFSPDSRWLAIWNQEAVRLIDSRTGHEVGRRIPAGGKLVNFSADGKRLGTATRLGRVQVWDVPSGEAVTELMQHPRGLANLPEFSPDGRFLKTENFSFHLWAIPPRLPEGTPPPEWLLELATVCASQVVDDAGQLVPATAITNRLERLRREIANLPAGAPLAEWGQWVLDDSPGRPIAPGFTITPAEAEALAASAAAMTLP